MAEERPGGDSGNHTENSGCWRGVRVSVSPVETALSSRASLSSRRPITMDCELIKLSYCCNALKTEKNEGKFELGEYHEPDVVVELQRVRVGAD